MWLENATVMLWIPPKKTVDVKYLHKPQMSKTWSDLELY